MSDNYGFAHNAQSDIARLRQLLEENYPPEAIIKELIQNANDASASELHIGWISGTESSHPLLRCPALLLLNNGTFTATDAAAIRELGIGSKGADERTIGKFGLGLKSVFHFCEAFFYVAHSEQPDTDEFSGIYSEKYLQYPILNPWGNSGHHDKWNMVSEIRSEMQATIQAWEHNAGRWFCLWIPLRTEGQLNGKVPIKHDFPNAQAIIDSIHADTIAPILPLLTCLKCVTVWDLNADGVLREKLVVRLEQSAQTRKEVHQLLSGESHNLKGRVISRSMESAENQLFFAGEEARPKTPSSLSERLDLSWLTFVSEYRV